VLALLVSLIGLASCSRPLAIRADPSPSTVTTAMASILTQPLHGRASRETSVLAFVQPPTSDCVHMVVSGISASYRLIGTWATRYPRVIPRPRDEELYWLTGHLLPHIETADHAILAPITSDCAGMPAFYVDKASTLTEWLSALLHALIVPLTPPQVPPKLRLILPAGVPIDLAQPAL
jgi:hypothetical protein